MESKGNLELQRMSSSELRKEFERRKALLLEVRNEIDRREKIEGRKGVRVEFTDYVENGEID